MQASEVREIALAQLRYDPETGAITWRVSTGTRARPGDIAGTICAQGYRNVVVAGKRRKAHRVVWLMTHGDWPSGCIDHINGVRDDNRLSNLRDVTLDENHWNRNRARGGSASGLIGVSLTKSTGRWRACVCRNKKVVNLGSYATKEQAHAAYVEFREAERVKVFGVYAPPLCIPTTLAV